MKLEFLKRLAVKLFTGHEEQERELDDNETRDKYLRSLRRERRMQMEELEKAKLLHIIKAFNRAKQQKYLWGIKNRLKNKAQKHFMETKYRF